MEPEYHDDPRYQWGIERLYDLAHDNFFEHLDVDDPRHDYANLNMDELIEVFDRLYLAAEASDWDTAFDGDYASWLEMLGLREPDWDFDVGDTGGET